MPVVFPTTGARWMNDLLGRAEIRSHLRRGWVAVAGWQHGAVEGNLKKITEQSLFVAKIINFILFKR